MAPIPDAGAAPAAGAAPDASAAPGSGATPDSGAAVLPELLHAMPDWVGAGIEPAGEVLLVAVFVVWLRSWMTARRSRPAAAGTALSVPVAVALAWAVSEFAKQMTRADRPCRVLDDLPMWADCPVPGDWSFPSNHAAVAGALAVGVVLTARHLRAPVSAVSALLGGVLAGVSRVLAGAHFPHDVVAGLALGGMVAAVTATLTGRLAAPVVVRWRARGRMPFLVGGVTARRCGSAERPDPGRRRDCR